MYAWTDHLGYIRITLKYKGAKVRRRVHQLVLEAFVGPRPEGMETGHLNGIRSDNRLCNLAWVTKSQNEAMKLAHGTKARGARNGRAKITPSIVRAILKRHANGETPSQIGRRFGVSHSCAAGVIQNKSWREVTSRYRITADARTSHAAPGEGRPG